MAALAHPATTLLVMIGEIEETVAIVATVAIDVIEDAVDHPDAPTATKMPMLRAEATETASAKIGMEVLVVIVESGNGTAIEAIGVLEGNTAVMKALGRLAATVTDLETTAVPPPPQLVAIDKTGVDETEVAEIVMRIFLRKIVVAEARLLPRSASPHQILPMLSLFSSGSAV